MQYDRDQVELVSMKKYEDSEKKEAERERLELELDLLERGAKHEVVLLVANSEEVIRKTHRRYFENASQISESSKDFQTKS